MSSNKSVLIVEDSLDFRKSLRWILEPKGFAVTEAEDGEEAQKIIQEFHVDLIISDLRMPKKDGLELHKWVLSNKDSTPFIIMTGHGDVTSTAEALKLGMQGFIPKPFEIKDVLEAVQLALNLPPLEEYSPIPISHFLSGQTLPYNVYVKTEEGKFVKICHKNEALDSTRVQNYRKKGAEFLYIRKSDLSSHIRMDLGIASALKTSSVVPDAQKKLFIQELGENIMRYAFREDIDRSTFDFAREYIETTLDIALESEEIFNLLKNIQIHSDYIYIHSLAVSAYSVLLAKTLGWTSPSTLTKIALGGLLHDIGKRELEPELLSRPLQKLSHLEKKRLESHVNRGVEMLTRIDKIPDEVVQIVYHHHESFSGGGFPQGLVGEQIFRLARVVSVANVFCNIVGRDHRADASVKESLEKMIWFEDTLDPEVLSALFKLCKVSRHSLNGRAVS